MSPEFFENGVGDTQDIKNEKKAQASEQERDALAEGGLSQVEIILNKFKRKFPTYTDWDSLRSAGVDGLMEAAKKYDATTGFKFNTFAESAIHGRMIDYLRRTGFGGRAAYNFFVQVEEATHRAAQAYGRTPTEEEIASQMGMSLHNYRKKITEHTTAGALLSTGYVEVVDPVEGKFFTELGLSALPAVAGEGRGKAISNTYKMLKNLEEAMANAPLNEDEKKVLNLYFYQDMDLEDAAKRMGLHASRVSQIKSSALKKIAKVLEKAGYRVPKKLRVYHNK